MNKKYLKIIIIILVILSIGITAGFVKKINNIKQAHKYFFNYNAYKDNRLKKYVDLAWEKYYKKEIPEELVKNLSESKQYMGIIIADLNTDNKQDILTMVRNTYFCGRSGAECQIEIFISNAEENYKSIDVLMNGICGLPIYILDSKTNGLKDIMLNEKYLLRFDKEVYK